MGIRYIRFSCNLEKDVAEALVAAGITFIHESEKYEQGLDFYLPQYDVYIEVKKFHANRIARQMASKDNVIAVQGKASVEFLIQALTIQINR